VQFFQVPHFKLFFQKFLQIKTIYIIISYENLVININNYDYNPIICPFYIKWKIYIEYLQSTYDKTLTYFI